MTSSVSRAFLPDSRHADDFLEIQALTTGAEA
jgi:hypothetical protein